jgi:hypothetical protein
MAPKGGEMIDHMEIFICRRCGAEFVTQYYHFGSIAHENQISDWNLNVHYLKGKLIETINEMDPSEKRCAMIWLRKNHPDEILKGLTRGIDVRLTMRESIPDLN